MVTVAVPSATWPERLHGLSGYLVPKPVQHLVTAVSFGSQKWQQWASDGQVVLRISLGRDGLPVLAETGIIEPGAFVEYEDGSVTRLGIVRSTQVEAGMPEVWQTLGVQSHA